MICNCGLEIYHPPRKMACPDCGAEVVVGGPKDSERLRAEIAELRQQLAQMESERSEALKLLYEHMGGPNPSTLVPAVKLVLHNANETMKLCVQYVAERNAAEAERDRLRERLRLASEALITGKAFRDTLVKCSTVGWPSEVIKAFYDWQPELFAALAAIKEE